LEWRSNNALVFEGGSKQSQEASESQGFGDGLFLLGITIWLGCGIVAFSVLMACALPSGLEEIDGTCSSRLFSFLLNFGLLALFAGIVVVCAAYMAKWVFEGFIACISHKWFARLQEWLYQNNPTWSWPTRWTLRQRLLPELRKDPRYIAMKQRNQRRALSLLMMAAMFAGVCMVYTHFHYFQYFTFSLTTSLKQLQYLSAPEDPHQILGVQQNASWTEIRKAYRRISLTCHPEKIEPWSMHQHECLTLMPRAHAAWDILSNHTLKVAWDQLPRKSFKQFLQV